MLKLLASPPERFEVYRNSVLSNLRGAMLDIYPVVQRLTGDKFFDQAATIFVREHASTSGDLHSYGRNFPLFLAEYEPAKALTYLPDVARLEWLWHEVFHCADAQPAEMSALAAGASEDYGHLRFDLQPGCRRLYSDFPVHRIWEANRPGYAGEERISLDEGNVWLLLYRFGFEVRIAPISQAEDALLESFAAGEVFEQAAARAMNVDPNVSLGAVMSRFVSEQIITGFSLEHTKKEGTT